MCFHVVCENICSFVRCLKVHPVFMTKVLPPSVSVYLNRPWWVGIMRKQLFWFFIIKTCSAFCSGLLASFV